jgi:hypothetical protein
MAIRLARREPPWRAARWRDAESAGDCGHGYDEAVYQLRPGLVKGASHLRFGSAAPLPLGFPVDGDIPL